MSVIITTKVGKGQPNFKTSDNTAIQNLLNKFIQPGALSGLLPLLPDGQIGPKTIAAITKFQREILGFKNPDSYVSPGGKTLATLNGPVIWPVKPPVPDVETPTSDNSLDATVSTEWAVRFVSYQNKVLKLELLNLTTDRAHQLVFDASGIDGRYDAVGWMSGSYYSKFKTNYPANFDNFNGTVTLLNPEAGYATIKHKMRIGWLATLDIHHCPGPGRDWNLFGTCSVVFGDGIRQKPRTYAPYYPHANAGQSQIYL